MTSGLPRFSRGTEPATRNLVALEIRGVPENIGHVRQLLAAFAGAHGAGTETRADVALAVTEAVTNAVLHGYRGRDPGSIWIVADYDDGAVEVVVADEGHGMAANVASAGLGLGLGLIARAAARFTVRERAPYGTEVWMRFHL